MNYEEEFNECMVEETPRFVIDSDSKCDWALRQIREAQEETERINAIAREQIKELEAGIKANEDKLESKTGFLKNCMYEYFQTVAHKETKTQESYKLFSGSLVYKKPSKKIVKNDDLLLDACKANGWNGYIKTKESVDWAELKKQLEITEDGQIVMEYTGEIVDGVTLEETAGSFDIKL